VTEGPALRYAVVTPVRNESANLVSVARDLSAQTLLPMRWVIVDTGSDDGTQVVANALVNDEPWIILERIDEGGGAARGGPIVRAFSRGLGALSDVQAALDVIIKLDADIGFEYDYFERLLRAFGEDPKLGIASGVCHELEAGVWTARWGTRNHVWGASRAYRAKCLVDVLPLEEREGWDEIDALRARLAGWRTGVVRDLPFRHYRTEGQRDGQRRRWIAKGESAYYMGYRPTYMVVRAGFRALAEPSAVLMLYGFMRAMTRRSPRLDDRAVRRYLREQQRLRSILSRASEARGAR
jgi:poly-beta-1,6-N-acetyl-D-glucosamine synthase